MACNPEVLKPVPLFALLDEDETAILAGQVELRKFAPRQRIYKMGEAGWVAHFSRPSVRGQGLFSHPLRKLGRWQRHKAQVEHTQVRGVAQVSPPLRDLGTGDSYLPLCNHAGHERTLITRLSVSFIRTRPGVVGMQHGGSRRR